VTSRAFHAAFNRVRKIERNSSNPIPIAFHSIESTQQEEEIPPKIINLLIKQRNQQKREREKNGRFSATLNSISA